MQQTHVHTWLNMANENNTNTSNGARQDGKDDITPIHWT